MDAIQYAGLVGMGIGAGAFGTLIGAGGGFVLMPLLMLLYPADTPETLTSISLAAVFFNALSGTEAYAHARRIDYRSALLFLAATLPGAVLGALNTSALPRRSFDILFAAAMLAVSAFLALRKPGQDAPAGQPQVQARPGGCVRTITDAHGQSWTYAFNPWLGVAISLLVGYASSFLGIGGGIIHVPLMVAVLGFPVHVATATSHFILAGMAFAGTMTHVFTGAFAHGAHRTAALAIGVALGAQLGARLSDRVGGTLIVRLLAGALALLGVRVFLQAMGAA